MLNAECGMLKAATTFVAAVLLALPASGEEKPAAYTTETIRGRVVFLAEVMQDKTGVAVVPEARERVLALEKKDGSLLPLLEDVRARAFRRDERLREMEVELVVRRYAISPLMQVIQVFEIAKSGKYEIDYWCDVCSIPM
ncbi:MAG TPA: hypothetical protein VGI40_18420, partial [Pirellulaceae bacterium]